MRPTSIAILFILGCGDDSGGASGDTDDVSTGVATGTTSPSTSSSTTADPSTTSSSSSTGEASTSTSESSTESGSSTGPEGTDGCGLAAEDPSAQWVAHTIDVGGTTRDYFVWLPDPYDPNRPYPVVYQFHGCSGSPDRQNNNPPVQDHSGADAIHIRGRAVDDCWDLAPGGSDVLFFDALVAEVEATWCANPERRFATGYSSGAFLTHRIACDRGDMLRGVASIAGGFGGNCEGQVAALLIHDFNDDVVDISASEGARDTHLQRNGCDTEMPTTPVDPSPCEAYAGCDEGYPVVWCQTEGQLHGRQDQLAAPAFWGFLNALP